MFVEKLTVFGFKSFNQKIPLTFGSGISGIIGPNGCGKSNIVDAIRWVLGEQSTKQLRGAKMEDVIFNGARNEKPMSMAQVELTLNNERGSLPIDYSTVTVGRRLYRSGVSEYYINKNTVRLKDVRELFLDTGMGSHAYSVIERQMVDNILSDNTGHRRFLFEEAAGIMKYKTRKKEALNKLDATQRDLVRVNDIVIEVERQVNSLKRQVGKARRHKELTTQIRTLDLDLSQNQRQSWTREIENLSSNFGDTRRTAEESETQVSALEAKLQEMHLAYLEKERNLQEAREALAQVDDEIGKANSRILVLRERLQSTGQRTVEIQQSQVRLAERLEKNAEETTRLSGLLEELSGVEEQERNSLQALEAALTSVEAGVSELRSRATESQQLTLEHLEEKVRTEETLAGLNHRVEEEEKRLGELDHRKQALALEAEELLHAFEVSTQTVSQAKKRLEELEAEKDRLQIERKNHESRVEMVRKETSSAHTAEAAAKSRLETLETLQARYEGFAPGVRALLAEGDRPQGVIGTLSDVIQIPADWVQALEPALSTAWQFVVTEDTVTARRLVDQLETESMGFASFLPLDRIPHRPRLGGDLVSAASLVSTEPRFQNLVDYLLGGVALADNLDMALDMVAQGRAKRAVTRQGHYVDDTAIAGGEGGPAGSELLEREEALERCRTEIEGLLIHLSEVANRQEKLDFRGRELVQSEKDIEERLTEAKAALNVLEKEQAELRLKREHALKVQTETRESLEERTAAKIRIQGERALLEAALKDSLHNSSTADQNYQTLANDLQEAERQREEKLKEAHQARLSWARLEGELKDKQSSAERYRIEKEDLLAEQARFKHEESDLLERKVEIEGELENLAERIEEFHGARVEKADLVALREREKADAAAAEQQDSELVREVRRRASEARQAAHEAEVKLTELRSNVAHLETRLHQEYEVTSEDLNRHQVGEIPENAEQLLGELKEKVRRLGPVNLLAVEEYEEKSERFAFMSSQRDDLTQAKDSLIKTIKEINKKASVMFIDTFKVVEENFQKTFGVLFQGGECQLSLTGDDPLEAEIDVMARPRGKKPQGIQQLSSGERALTAIALLFAIYLVKPSPFCILDEVDAPLDDANIDRFVAMIKEFSKRTQFIMITHNKKTMEAAESLYGVTMQTPGVSSVVSVKLDGSEMPQTKRGRASGIDDESVSPESTIAQ